MLKLCRIFGYRTKLQSLESRLDIPTVTAQGGDKISKVKVGSLPQWDLVPVQGEEKLRKDNLHLYSPIQKWHTDVFSWYCGHMIISNNSFSVEEENRLYRIYDGFFLYHHPPWNNPDFVPVICLIFYFLKNDLFRFWIKLIM